MSYDDVHQVLRDLGYDEDAKPKTQGWVQPHHRPDEEPADQVAEDTDPPRRNTTSDRPIPTEPRYTPSDPNDFTHLRAGEQPVDNTQDIRALADKIWAQRNY